MSEIHYSITIYIHLHYSYVYYTIVLLLMMNEIESTLGGYPNFVPLGIRAVLKNSQLCSEKSRSDPINTPFGLSGASHKRRMSWLFGPSSATLPRAVRWAPNALKPKQPNVYNLHRLQKLYHNLAYLTLFDKIPVSGNLHINDDNRVQVVEILRAISELIVYGSQGEMGREF